MCRADAKAVADVNRFLNQAFRREVLAENAVRKVYSREFLAPRRVMLRRIRVNSLFDSSFHGQVRLLISVQADLRATHPPLHRTLADTPMNYLPHPIDNTM